MSKSSKKIGIIICFILFVTPLFQGYLSIKVGNTSSAQGALGLLQSISSTLNLSGVSSSISNIQRQVSNLEDGSLSIVEFIDFMYTCSSSLDSIVSSCKTAMEKAGSALSTFESFTGGLTSGLTDSYNSSLGSLQKLQWELRIAFVLPAVVSAIGTLSFFGGLFTKPKKPATPLICNIILLLFAFYNCGGMAFASDAHAISVSIWMLVSLASSVGYMILASAETQPSYGGASYSSAGRPGSAPKMPKPKKMQKMQNVQNMQGGYGHTTTASPLQNSAAPTTQTNTYCVTCGKKKGKGTFCIGCGQNLAVLPEELKFCSTCAKPHTDGGFCPYCGENYPATAHGGVANAVPPAPPQPVDFQEPPMNIQEPPMDFQEPPMDIQEPPVDIQEPPMTFQEPPMDIQEPPVDFQEPPVDFQEPPMDIQEPPMDIQEPPVVFQEPQMDFQEPPVDFQEPPVDFQEPPMDIQEPPMDIQEPPMTFQEPPVDFQEPPMTFQEPPMDIQEPPMDFQEPPMDIQEPPVDFQEPPVDIQEPPMDIQEPPVDIQKPPVPPQPGVVQRPPVPPQSGVVQRPPVPPQPGVVQRPPVPPQSVDTQKTSAPLEGFCTQCGASGNQGKFCRKCGTPLMKGE